MARAQGRNKHPYQLFLKVKAESAQDPEMQKVAQAFAANPGAAYEIEGARAALIAKLKAKHGLSLD